MKIVAISLLAFFAGIAAIALLCYATRKVTQAFDYLTHPQESLDRWEPHYTVFVLLHEENTPNEPIKRLIAALDDHLSRHFITMRVDEYDLLCEGIGLEPACRETVEAIMACGWRMKLVFSNGEAMDGLLEYHATKDKRLYGEVNQNAS